MTHCVLYLSLLFPLAVATHPSDEEVSEDLPELFGARNDGGFSQIYQPYQAQHHPSLLGPAADSTSSLATSQLQGEPAGNLPHSVANTMATTTTLTQSAEAAFHAAHPSTPQQRNLNSGNGCSAMPVVSPSPHREPAENLSLSVADTMATLPSDTGLHPQNPATPQRTNVHSGRGSSLNAAAAKFKIGDKCPRCCDSSALLRSTGVRRHDTAR